MTTKIAFTLSPDTIGQATEVMLLGDFNNWEPAQGIYLQKKQDGSLHTEIDLVAGKTYQYKYLLSDGNWISDASANTAWAEVYGHFVENNVIEVPCVEVVAPKKNSSKAPAKKAEAKKQPIAADDLTKIEGIGKQIAGLLKKKDIITFKELGKCNIKTLKTMLEEAGPKYNVHNPGSWPKQAKLAAANKWEELQALQHTLKAGK